jgi:putative inorganic carbon (HCO3(-)) transporter
LKYHIAGVVTGIAIYASILFLNDVLIPQAQSGEFYSHSVGRPMAHTSGRSIMWRFSIEDGINNPIIGTGPTQYACEHDITLPAHPHSFPLRILGEWGSIAALMVILLAFTIGLKFLKELKQVNETRQTDPPLRSLLSVSLIAGIIHACLSGLMIMPASQVAMILSGGWVLSYVGSTRPRRGTLYTTNLLLLVGVTLAFSQFVFAIKELPNLAMRTSYSANYGSMMPRFWQDGRVCEYEYSSLSSQK